MNQEKFGKLIKDIRKKYNLTQKDLADKYNVSYQAVSKWENGKNLPDITLIKQISNDYNVKIDDLMDGKLKRNYTKYFLIGIILVLIIITIIALNHHNNDFEFKTITTTCEDFNITGSISYNEKKSAIYISNITYCGGDDFTLYNDIACNLYEKKGSIINTIDTVNYNDVKPITLDIFLKDISFKIDNYSKICKDYNENSLYLEIDAINNKKQTIKYTIPLKLNDEC